MQGACREGSASSFVFWDSWGPRGGTWAATCTQVCRDTLAPVLPMASRWGARLLALFLAPLRQPRWLICSGNSPSTHTSGPVHARSTWPISTEM